MEIVDVLETIQQYIPSQYIITIITTSITGSILLFNQTFSMLNINKNSYIIIFYILVIILSLIGGAFQFKFSVHKLKDKSTDNMQ